MEDRSCWFRPVDDIDDSDLPWEEGTAVQVVADTEVGIYVAVIDSEGFLDAIPHNNVSFCKKKSKEDKL